MVSTWNGSMPMTSGFSSWMAASTVLPKQFSVPSPTPWMPSSVETFANTQFFQGLPAMYVSMAVILNSSVRCVYLLCYSGNSPT